MFSSAKYILWVCLHLKNSLEIGFFLNCKFDLFHFLFRPLKMGRNLEFGCVIVFSFCFHAKSATTNNHRTGLSVEKSRFEPFDFLSNFERVSGLSLAYLCMT